MNSNQPNDVIDQMVELRLQHTQLNQRIEALKPAFHQACTAFCTRSSQGWIEKVARKGAGDGGGDILLWRMPTYFRPQFSGDH